MTHKRTREILKSNRQDIDITIARFMFEKFGTLPEEVLDMDDYNKGIVWAFLEQISEEHEKRIKEIDGKRRRTELYRYK